MKWASPLTEGRLVRRYQRFLADVDLGGSIVTAHCPNTGSMLGCADPGSRVWLSPAANPGRKLAWTWEMVEADGTLVGINTGRANALVREAIESGAVPALSGYGSLRAEVRYGRESSRADFLLSGGPGAPCYVEVKNVTAAVRGGVALFPDAVSERGTRHLREMMAMVRSGHRSVLVFCVQRDDVSEVRPADDIDPEYGGTLRKALKAGVEAVALRARVGMTEIRLDIPIPVVCP
jgi:sugar fermentation stimulation protein A